MNFRPPNLKPQTSNLKLAALLCASVPLWFASSAHAQLPLRLACDSAVRKSAYIPDLNNNSASASFVRGDDVLLEVGLFQNGRFFTNLSTYTNLTCQVFTSQNTTNGPLMAQAVTNGTASWNNNVTYGGWTNNSLPDTNWHALFYFPDTQTSIPLNGQASQTYWVRVFATTTNNRVLTYLEGPITVYDGPISPEYAAPAWPNVLFVDSFGNLVSPGDFFVQNSNQLNAALGPISIADITNLPSFTNTYLHSAKGGNTTNDSLVVKTNLAVGGGFSTDAGLITTDGNGDLTVNGDITMPYGAGYFNANGNQVTGANLTGSTNLNANIAFGGGIIPQQFEGSGSANNGTFLRGDHTWQAVVTNNATTPTTLLSSFAAQSVSTGAGAISGNGVGLTNTPAADVTNNFLAFTSLVFSGDSITFGYLVGGTNYAYFLTNVMGLVAPLMTNTAISGQTAAAISNNFAAQIGNFATVGGLVLIEAGKNDIPTGLPAPQIFSYLTNLWQRSRALGSYVCAGTVPPSWGGASSNPVWEQVREDLNNLIRNASAQWDYLVDWDYICPSPATHPEFWQDGVTHPSIYGNGRIATNYYQVLQRGRHQQNTKPNGMEQNPFANVGALSNLNVALATYQNPLPNMSASNNTFVGPYAGVGATSADSDTFVGNGAGGNTTSGGTNTAAGSQSLDHSTTGAYNTAYGYGTLRQALTDSQNTAIGTSAMAASVGASNDVAVGCYAFLSGSTGSYDTAVGRESMFLGAVTGYFDTAIGDESLRNLTTGSNNTAAGYQALYHNTTGQYNTAAGVNGQYTATTALTNTSLGYGALQNNTASNNIAIGHNAGKFLTLQTSGNNIYIGNYTSSSPVSPEFSNEVFIGSPGQTVFITPLNLIASNGVSDGSGASLSNGVARGNGSGLTNLNAILLPVDITTGSGTGTHYFSPFETVIFSSGESSETNASFLLRGAHLFNSSRFNPGTTSVSTGTNCAFIWRTNGVNTGMSNCFGSTGITNFDSPFATVDGEYIDLQIVIPSSATTTFRGGLYP